MSPLARREARWGLIFISPWIDRLLRVHAAADDRDAAVHLHQRQPEPDEPLRFVGLDNYGPCFGCETRGSR
jgi:hypothetical protein